MTVVRLAVATALAVAPLALPARAEAAAWTVDAARSRIGFSGVQVGAPFQGRFKRFSAQIDFDPAAPETGHAVVDIDLASAETGDAQRDASLPQAEWFDVKAMPQARFEATRFVARGGDAYEAVGSLTIRGIRRDAVLPFRLTRERATARAVGHLDLVRTQFGVGQGPWASGQWVALEVGVDIDLTATQAASKP
ncbi:polyisoprenoid-binding protein [Methylobacterium sp. Leaf104]|uniref:YceI family protein n=1 Tax=Methylobacterium TaxID=407 RepID=UPI000700CDAC|nr:MULTISPECIES: YceI family protein [Methylobacterium]KQP38291.1 polyisoprenoid-binding protein [Methylobacterium sp. Leaf104]MCI9880317.1 YceI family protein [Methylobacterium goesingense]